jgi:ABC-type nitrate/sulfonate/bicarbonate transport system substrate-binding protein
MRRLIARAAVPVAAAMSLALAACGSSSPTSSSTGSAAATTGSPVSVSVISYPGSDSSWLAYIAQQQGFFKANDLNVSFVSLQAGPQAMAALVGGSADIGILDTDNMAPLLEKGQKYTLLINAVTNFWALVGNKSLAGKSLAQVVQALKGQGVTAPSVGGTGGRQLDAIFAAYGLPASSVKITADPTNVSLTAGRVQAAMTDTIGACRLTTLGYPEIMNFVDPPQDKSSYPAGVQSLIGLPGLGYWAKSSWAAANPAGVSHFQKAIEQATAWAKNPANTAAEDTLLRNSAFNLATMTSSQWATCVSRVTAAFSNSYTAADAALWQKFVTSQGIASSLPPSSQWLAAGIPQS